MTDQEMLLIAPERCSGCGRCVAVCPEKILTLQSFGHRKRAVLTAPSRYTRCAICVTACPLDAVTFLSTSKG